jgi:hypothetical protein
MLPTYPLPTRQEQNQTQVWDFIRKKWVHLSPEEEVRQCLLHYLVKEKHLSPALIAIEREIPYFDLRKRFDVVVFGKNGKPWLICECKAPQVALSQEVLYQIARYNASLQAPHLLITNGPQLLFFSLNEKGKYDFQESGWVGDD